MNKLIEIYKVKCTIGHVPENVKAGNHISIIGKIFELFNNIVLLKYMLMNLYMLVIRLKN